MESAIRTAHRTGEVVIGFSRVRKSLMNGKLKAIIFSTSLPMEKRRELEALAKIAKIPIKGVEITSPDLGGFCDKPFPVAIIGIKDFGQSKLEEMIKR